MNASENETPAETARRWRRWLWQTSLTGMPKSGLSFEDAVYQGDDLAVLMGNDAYAELVMRLADDLSPFDVEAAARQISDKIFPHACRCRRHAALDHDSIRFDRTNVYRALYFSDRSVVSHMRVLFRRTPDLTLYECVECGDVWMGAFDQAMWEQHLLLIEPEDIARIEAEGVWPDGLDSFEDAWVAELGTIGRNSPDLRDWQAANNPAEAVARFGK